jgi:hypothetical protein
MTDSVYRQVLDLVVTGIRSLALSGIESSEIALRKLPWDDQTIHKGITVSWEQEKQSASEPEATNDRDMIGYPAVVTMISGSGRGFGDRITGVTDWRQRIRRQFNNKRLAGVVSTDVNEIICRVVFNDVHVPDRYLKNWDVSRMTIWCWFLEPRDN